MREARYHALVEWRVISTSVSVLDEYTWDRGHYLKSYTLDYRALAYYESFPLSISSSFDFEAYMVVD